MSLLDDPQKSIFSVWNLESRSTDDQGRGTAVAISGDLLVTCEHVVRDAEEVTLISHHPLFEGKNVMKGKVIGTDKNLDLALLRSSNCLPFSLELEGKEDLDDSIPLMIWSWPGWNAWWAACREKGIQAITPSTLRQQRGQFTSSARRTAVDSWFGLLRFFSDRRGLAKISCPCPASFWGLNRCFVLGELHRTLQLVRTTEENGHGPSCATQEPRSSRLSPDQSSCRLDRLVPV